MRKKDVPDWSKHITKLRESQGMNQDLFAKEIGATQGRVSEWESGKTNPSVEAWIKLGALAAKSDPSLANFFWKQTGLGPELVTSLAGALLQGGEAQAGSLLAAAGAILKQRIRESEALTREGKGVLVPPFAEGIWRERHINLQPVLVDASWVRNEESTFYLRTDELKQQQTDRRRRSPARGRGFVPGDLIIFDSCKGLASGLVSFIDRPVLISVTDVGADLYYPRPQGLFIGLLQVLFEGNVASIVLDRYDGSATSGEHLLYIASYPVDDLLPKDSQQVGETDSLWPGGPRFEEFTRDIHSSWNQYVDPRSLAIGLREVIRQNRAIRTVRRRVRLPSGYEVMGYFVGLLSRYAKVRQQSKDDIATPEDVREAWLRSMEDEE